MAKIETRGLTKRFGDFTAVDAVDISIEEGEIRAIIGENGAGKTTLMNMLYGLLQPNEGEILFSGQPVKLHSPKDAIECGVGMVHQHFKLVPSLTVYENLLLGVEINKEIKIGNKKVKSPIIDYKREKKVVKDLIDKFNFHLKVDDRVADISVGERQRLEILKMLYRNVDVLILDEPTAVLTPQEVDVLMQNLYELRKQGKTIIIITHKLAEVKMCADTITVIRGGKHIVTVKNADATPEFLAEKMVGRHVAAIDRTRKNAVGECVYQIKDLTAIDKNGHHVLKGISLHVSRGEIVGVAGVEGNGQSDLIMIITGLMRCTGGSISIDGKDVSGKWPDALRAAGMGIIPEDRYVRGLCTGLRVSYNLIAGYHKLPKYCKNGFMRTKNINENKKQLVEQYDIRLSSKDPPIADLSGGNAQKIIIARELNENPALLLACQPTRGLDLGSTEFVQNQLLKMRDEGKAVLLISSDLAEIMSLSDRIAVMYRGQIVGEFNAGEVTSEEVGLYMAGAKSKLSATGA